LARAVDSGFFIFSNSASRNSSDPKHQQLIGRTGRQGERGSAQFLVSVEDHLLVRHAPEIVARLRKLVPDGRGELPAGTDAWFRRIQMRVEQDAREQRRRLVAYDRRIDELKKAI
jgi:preprotein translocase subunit SecA